MVFLDVRIQEGARKGMKTTAVKPMRCEFADEGVLWIDKIATGVGVILYNPQHKFAAGFHVLRGKSKGQRADNPAYFADTVIEYAVQEFLKRSIPLKVSVAIAGGASLLSSNDQNDVGAGLISQVKEILAGKKLDVKIESIGGTKLRTMILNVDEGKIKIS
jgi:chemotaxis receptor (MCP) glutamine deamidase CheD